jgi:hypothetical protein
MTTSTRRSFILFLRFLLLTLPTLTDDDPQRLKEMKQMQRDPLASSKARKAERKADEKSGLITIKPLKLESAGGGGWVQECV